MKMRIWWLAGCCALLCSLGGAFGCGGSGNAAGAGGGNGNGGNNSGAPVINASVANDIALAMTEISVAAAQEALFSNSNNDPSAMTVNVMSSDATDVDPEPALAQIQGRTGGTCTIEVVEDSRSQERIVGTMTIACNDYHTSTTTGVEYTATGDIITSFDVELTESDATRTVVYDFFEQAENLSITMEDTAYDLDAEVNALVTLIDRQDGAGIEVLATLDGVINTVATNQRCTGTVSEAGVQSASLSCIDE